MNAPSQINGRAHFPAKLRFLFDPKRVIVGDMQIVTLPEARALGLKHYFTGRPCRRGHVSLRTVTSATCLECERVKYHASQKGRQKVRAWQAANRDKMRAASNRWKAENREACRVHDNNRRSRKRSVAGAFTSADIADINRLQGYKCANGCGTSTRDFRHIDHIVPLARGGHNGRRNLQLLCAPCNWSKHKKDPIDWARDNGRLI